MMEPTDVVKIFTASLAGHKKYKACGIYDGEVLIITHITQLGKSGLFRSWKEELFEELTQKRSQG